MESGQGGAGPSVDHRREPCPDRIIDDVGGAFGMGAVGGGVWHLIKGIKNSPSGARMLGGVQASVKMCQGRLLRTYCLHVKTHLLTLADTCNYAQQYI